MANFFTDNSDLKHHLTHPLMQRIVALKEREYADARKYDYAPVDFEDAMDSYEKCLKLPVKFAAKSWHPMPRASITKVRA